MRAAIISSLLFIGIAVFVTDASAATYYVDDLDPSCVPTNPGSGSINDPWRNFLYAVRQLHCGDTLNARGGTYRLDVTGFNSTACGANGEYAVAAFTQSCTNSNHILVQPYGNETVILDATSTQIDDASPTSHWTQCESSSRCGTCTGLALKDYTRTYYSEPWNFGSIDTEQVWIDPQCNDADANCSNPTHTGTRLRWIGASYGSCSNLNNLDGTCDTRWSSPACGSFDTGALPNAVVVRLPDTMGNPDPDTHIVKISCQNGTCASSVMRFDNAHYIDIRGGSHMILKYGYDGIDLGSGSDHILIDGVKIVGSGGRDYGNGFRTGDANYITIQNSEVAESASEGIAFYGGINGSCTQIHDNLAANNIVHDTGFASSSNAAGQVLDDGILMKSCSNCIARGNTLYDNGRAGVKLKSDANSSGLCSANNDVIEQNTIYRSCNSVSQYMNSDCAGITIPPAGGSVGAIQGTTIRNNIVRDESGLKGGLVPHGIKIDSGVGSTAIINNTVTNIANNCLDTNENSSGAGTFTVRNNALSKCNVGNVGGAGWAKMHAFQDWTHSNNSYWGDTNDSTAILSAVNGPVARDSVTGQFEATAIQRNPSFVSATDLHLGSGSPLIDAGAATGAPAVDLFGTPRPQGGGWDIGAIEGASGTLSPPTLLSVVPAP